MPTTQEAAITNLRTGIRHNFRVYRAEVELTQDDEAAIIPGWVPTGPTWSDVTAQLRADSKITIKADNTITFAVRNHNRSEWQDDRAIVIIAQHWDGAAWCPFYVAGWGYIRGDGRQDDLRFEQYGEVTVTYLDRLKKRPLPAHHMGRPNLAKGASIGGATPAIADAIAEVPLEFTSQADGAATRAVDGNSDTAYVSDTVCDPDPPVKGDSVYPRILRICAGRTVRTIGAGGEPLWVEIWAGHDLTPWGTTWIGVPEMYNAPAGEGMPAERTEPGKLKYEVVTYGDGTKGFRSTSYMSANPKLDTWIQWIIQSGYTRMPFRVTIEIKAGHPDSIGKAVMIGVTDAAPTPSFSQLIDPVVLTADWQRFQFDSADSGNYGGAKLSIKTKVGELLSGDMVYEIRRFQVAIGFDNDVYGPLLDYKTLHLGMDDGAGHEKWVRIAWNLAKKGNWRIEPFGSVIITDNLSVFKSKFDAGGRTVYEMQREFPYWFFGPSVGRIKLMFAGADIHMDDLDFIPPDAIVLDDIDMSVVNGGVPWLPRQALTRQSPLGTGYLAVEDYPQQGMETTYGQAFLWVDLGEYVPPTLSDAITAADLLIPVSDPDEYPAYGTIRIGTEDIIFVGKDGEYLIATTRGANSTVAAAHSATDPVVPCYDDNAGPGATAQTGPLIDKFVVRRKPGTPVIASGAIIWSNLPAPGNPSSGGAKWELHPDWELGMRFAGNKTGDIEFIPPSAEVRGGYANVRQARHWAIVCDRMAYANGKPQRFKVNEVIARKFSPAAGQSGAYAGHGAGDYTGVVGHLLTQHGGLPVSKFIPQVSGVPLSELSITPSNVQSAVQSAIGGQYLTIYNDAYNRVYLTGAPGSFLFSALDIEWAWTPSNAWGVRTSGDWSEAHPCAQVVMHAIEAATMRQYVIKYPEMPDLLGDVITVKDVHVTSEDQAREMTRALYRRARTRRKISVQAGACPWIKRYQRHTINFPDLDRGAEWDGLNVYVDNFTITIGLSDKGSITWNTAVDLVELAL